MENSNHNASEESGTVIELKNIDLLCKRFSEEMAAKMLQQSISGTSINELNEQTQVLINKYGLTAGCGPVQSSFVKEGKVIEFSAFTQSFEINSKKLFDCALLVSKHIKLKLDSSNKEVKQGLQVDVEFGENICPESSIKEARFSYSGKKFIAVSGEGEQMMLEGGQQGQYIQDGGILLINIALGNLETLVHEVLHSKIDPNNIAKLDSPIGDLGNQLCKMIKERNPDVWSNWHDALDEAKAESLDTMISFDAELESIFPTDEW